MDELPGEWENYLLGDPSQLPSRMQREGLIRNMVLRRGGPDGATTRKALRSLRLLLARARAYQLPNYGLPASAALVGAIVQAELKRAMDAAKGSQGGRSVGKTILEGFALLEKLGLPIVVKGALVELAAAPPADVVPRPRRHAGSLPLQVQLQFETIAASARWSVARTMARALLTACVVHHVRLNDALNAVLWPDEAAPNGVIRGRTQTGSKDGLPLDLFAPAKGWLGPFYWLREHLAEMAGRNHAIPDWVCRPGAKSSVACAVSLAPGVISPTKCRSTVQQLLAMPPLKLSQENFKAWNVTTHSFHGTGADMARFLGFPHDEIRALGHWLRDRNAPADNEAARLAHGRAHADARKAMSVRYTQGPGRLGEREQQLKVRSKLCECVRAALQRHIQAVDADRDAPMRSWLTLPGVGSDSGTADWQILRPTDADAQ